DRAGEPDEHELPGDRADGTGDRVGDLMIPGCAVVQRAVRLDVTEVAARRASEGRDGADLVDDRRLELVGAHVELAPAEAREIRVTRMRPDRDAVSDGRGDRALDRHRIARVQPAGEVHAR